ncbi:hypothetical protein F0562_015409 [Nyssa sinensis]|uniref:Retrotransposon Copia-like N-terminal domain-containing protein n=1 Tax=Nyssa sinensis TaxID=561372 RepID=A0A5J4ZH71_9ASTE|nr:hypothetical protein F0562_015409 [Nyssa sinensis]
MVSNVESTQPSQKFDDPSHHLLLSSSDNPGVVLVSQPLTETNYTTWSQSMFIALDTKNKFGFIDGTIPKLSKSSPTEYRQWSCYNNMLLWDDLASLQSHLFQENIAQYQQYQHTMKFLMGLNESFGAIRAQILLINPLHIINRIYGLVLQEECQRNIQTSSPIDGVALAAKGSKPRAHQVSSADNNSSISSFPFTLDQCQQLLAVLNTATQSSSMANHVGNIASSLSGKPPLLSPETLWILDSGATDQMVCSPADLTYSIPVHGHTVQLPNGSHAVDLCSMRMIGLGTERDGLYYFTRTNPTRY